MKHRSMSEETVRDTITVQADGRTTIPNSVRVAVGIDKQKAFCQVENFGKDKFLVTVLTKWMPNPQRKERPRQR
jgi:bifunctional DNA-binding transcriptional regulator/antitoxin component of YhaV-PrlF toxin-antitoxin module